MFSLFKIKEIKKDILFSFVIFLVLSLLYLKKFINIINFDENIYGTIITSVITLFGFVLTVLAIIVSFPPNYKIDFIKKSEIYHEIYNVYFFAIAVLVLILLTTTIIKLLDFQWLNFILIFFVVLSFFSLYRCLWILKKLIGILHS